METKQEQRREYTFPRDGLNSVIKLWIEGRTGIGPVLQVKTICHLDICAIEIQIPSTSGNGSTSWVVISQGSKRHVEELRYNDPDHSPENFEEANYRSIVETRAEQPTTQSRSQCSQSQDHIPVHKRKWIDITSDEYCQKPVWEEISRNLS